MSCCKTSKWQRKEWDHQMAPTYHTTHSTRHSKSEVFELLSETKGLWIRDFCQKVLPMRFRERQCDYFGKKGMTLHIDVILCRNENGEIEKKAYFTAASSCNSQKIFQMSRSCMQSQIMLDATIVRFAQSRFSKFASNTRFS